MIITLNLILMNIEELIKNLLEFQKLGHTHLPVYVNGGLVDEVLLNWNYEEQNGKIYMYPTLQIDFNKL